MNARDAVPGAAAPVVFLHGWGYGSAVWNDMLQRLRTGRAMHAIDLPGYGGSPYEACAPDALAADVARRAPARCVVVGWSLGAQVALRWALVAPRQVEALALIAATPCFVERADWREGMPRTVFDAFARDAGADPAATLKRFALLAVRGEERLRDARRGLDAALAAQPMPAPVALAGGLDLLRNTDLRQALGSVAQPVLVIHGDRDGLVTRGAAEHLAGALPEGALTVIPGAAHAPFLAHADAVAHRLEAFLDERRIDA